jgi:hypothetical protein
MERRQFADGKPLQIGPTFEPDFPTSDPRRILPMPETTVEPELAEIGTDNAEYQAIARQRFPELLAEPAAAEPVGSPLASEEVAPHSDAPEPASVHQAPAQPVAAEPVAAEPVVEMEGVA